jgi:formylmethanofuran dehydrogenase subunit E
MTYRHHEPTDSEFQLKRPPETVPCSRCGLRFVRYYNVNHSGSGLCRYCAAALKRMPALGAHHGMV